ncbi:MAG: hypothetical protein ACJ712_08175 [Nitrososphaeraceae archaeon]
MVYDDTIYFLSRGKKNYRLSSDTYAMLGQATHIFILCCPIIYMSDTGFTCPKCDHSFPTAEQVAEHLRNEHTDGTQTESTKRMI